MRKFLWDFSAFFNCIKVNFIYLNFNKYGRFFWDSSVAELRQ